MCVCVCVCACERSAQKFLTKSQISANLSTNATAIGGYFSSVKFNSYHKYYQQQVAQYFGKSNTRDINAQSWYFG
jgi:hypothetical protein